jgi:hypothetical protein
MADLRKVDAPDESLLFRFRRLADPIPPWVLQEIPEHGISEVVAVQLELQKSIYQAKLATVDKLVAQTRSRK